MPATEVKPRSKPPTRRVPPGENRTARNFTMGVAMSAEELKAINEIGRILGFRSGGPMVSWIIGNMFELAKNPLHAPVWEADFYSKLRKMGLITDSQKMPDLAGEIIPAMMTQIAASIDNAFGASEKPAPVNPGGLSEGGSHGDSS